MLLFCHIYIQCRWLICDTSKTAILTLSSNRFIHTGFTAVHGARGVPVGYIQWPTGYLGFQFLLVILAIFFYFPPSERRWAMHCISATCWKDNGGMGCLGCRSVAVVDLEQKSDGLQREIRNALSFDHEISGMCIPTMVAAIIREYALLSSSPFWPW